MGLNLKNTFYTICLWGWRFHVKSDFFLKRNDGGDPFFDLLIIGCFSFTYLRVRLMEKWVNVLHSSHKGMRPFLWWKLTPRDTMSKILSITITSCNFNCPVKLERNVKLKLRSKFNHDFTNHDYLDSAFWKALYNFKIKITQETRHNQFFFPDVQNNEIFEIFKMFKNKFKVKFDTKINSKMQNSMVVSILSVLDWK